MDEKVILLDTDVLISLAKGHKQTLTWFETQHNVTFAISSVSLFELYLGAFGRLGKKHLTFIDSLCTFCTVIELTFNDMRVAAQISAELQKQGRSLNYRDIFIATAALKEEIPIKTGNITHYSRIPKITICE